MLVTFVVVKVCYMENSLFFGQGHFRLLNKVVDKASRLALVLGLQGVWHSLTYLSTALRHSMLRTRNRLPSVSFVRASLRAFFQTVYC